jgi:hypothetical protein
MNCKVKIEGGLFNHVQRLDIPIVDNVVLDKVDVAWESRPAKVAIYIPEQYVLLKHKPGFGADVSECFSMNGVYNTTAEEISGSTLYIVSKAYFQKEIATGYNVSVKTEQGAIPAQRFLNVRYTVEVVDPIEFLNTYRDFAPMKLDCTGCKSTDQLNQCLDTKVRDGLRACFNRVLVTALSGAVSVADMSVILKKNSSAIAKSVNEHFKKAGCKISNLTAMWDEVRDRPGNDFWAKYCQLGHEQVDYNLARIKLQQDADFAADANKNLQALRESADVFNGESKPDAN